MEEMILEKCNQINNQETENFDDTLPVEIEKGSLHPITIVSKEITDILKRMGFTVVTGPENGK